MDFLSVNVHQLNISKNIGVEKKLLRAPQLILKMHLMIVKIIKEVFLYGTD